MFGADRDFAVEFRDRQGQLVTPDFTQIARGFGAQATKVTSLADLPAALESAIATEGPVVVEAMLARDPQNTEGINAGYWDLPVPEYLVGRAGA
jgi:acetolactate synthase-1/2/3 large subunit